MALAMLQFMLAVFSLSYNFRVARRHIDGSESSAGAVANENAVGARAMMDFVFGEGDSTADSPRPVDSDRLRVINGKTITRVATMADLQEMGFVRLPVAGSALSTSESASVEQGLQRYAYICRAALQRWRFTDALACYCRLRDEGEEAVLGHYHDVQTWIARVILNSSRPPADVKLHLDKLAAKAH
jgi:hypothetical protein